MKKLSQILMVLVLTGAAFSVSAQKKIKSGIVKFEMKTDSSAPEELAMLGESAIDFYFTQKTQKMDMNMMGGLIRVQTITEIDNPGNAAMLMDMMGQKIHVTGLTEEQVKNSNSMLSTDKAKNVTYDKGDTKTIAGYKCHAAKFKTEEGVEMKFYVTDDIEAPQPKNTPTESLKGYPLEMQIDTGQGFSFSLVAKEVLNSVSESDFAIPEGYQKMTMEEFEKSMGGGFGMFGK